KNPSSICLCAICPDRRSSQASLAGFCSAKFRDQENSAELEWCLLEQEITEFEPEIMEQRLRSGAGEREASSAFSILPSDFRSPLAVPRIESGASRFTFRYGSE